MTTWADVPSPTDEYGEPMFRGIIELRNDKGENLGGICWFYDEGPFYASAMDANDVSVIRRIGPISTIEGAKNAIIEAIEGKKDLSNRAAYPR